MMSVKTTLLTRDAVGNVYTPPATHSHKPIAHAELMERTLSLIGEFGYEVRDERHELTRGGANYFGRFQVWRNEDITDDYNLQIGIRNSHCKNFAAGLVIGSHVIVCSNLSFYGDVKVARKHTLNIERDLETLMFSAFGRLMEFKTTQDQRFTAYKGLALTDDRAAKFTLDALAAGAINPCRVEKVWESWVTPPHVEFEGRTMWSLFNAFTEAYKGSSGTDILLRSGKLHRMADKLVIDRVAVAS